MRKLLILLLLLFAAFYMQAQTVVQVSKPQYFLKWIKVHDSVRASIYLQNPNDTLATRAYARGFAGGGLSAGIGIKVSGNTVSIDTLHYRKQDSMYVVNDTSGIFKINGVLYPFIMRGALFAFNGRKGNIIPQSSDYGNFYLRVDSIYSDPAAIGSLRFSKLTGLPSTLLGYNITDAVKNAGGAISFQSDLYVNRPGFGHLGAFFLATDSSVLFFDNGAAWQRISNGNANAVDSAVLGQYGILKTTAGTNIILKVDTTTLKGVFGSTLGGITQIFTKYGLLINGTDTASVDTTKLITYTDTLPANGIVTKTFLISKAYLTTETDPVAVAKTVTVTQGSGILVTGTATQNIGGNPAYTLKADTLGVLATLTMDGKKVVNAGGAAKWQSGIFSARPTAGAVGGLFYLATDSLKIYFDNGASWLVVSGNIDLTTLLLKANNLSDLANKPTAVTNLGLKSAAYKDTAVSGNASASQVVTGNDTRLAAPTLSNVGSAFADTVKISTGTPTTIAGATATTAGVQSAADKKFSDSLHVFGDTIRIFKKALTDSVFLGVKTAGNSEVLAFCFRDSAGGSSGGALLIANNLSDLSNVATALTNLGIGTAGTKNVAASGNASSTQVVLGSDTRLTTNISQAASATADTLKSSTGTGPTLNGASHTFAGLQTAADKQRLDSTVKVINVGGADTCCYFSPTLDTFAHKSNEFLPANVSNLNVTKVITQTKNSYTFTIGSNVPLLNLSNTFTQPQIFPIGSVSTPGIAFAGFTNTGLYYANSVPTISFPIGGTSAFSFSANTDTLGKPNGAVQSVLVAPSVGNNTVGKELRFYTGISTGTGNSGDFSIYTSPHGTTGTSLNSTILQFTLNGETGIPKFTSLTGSGNRVLVTDASGNISAFSSAIPVGSGGTGALTFTAGYLKANGTSAFNTVAAIPGTDISGDIPGNAANVTGTVGLARGGTNANLSGTGGAGQYLKQSSVGAAITVGTIPGADIVGDIAGNAAGLTSVPTGIIKGNGTVFSAAASGTDYAPGTSGLTTGIVKSTTTTGALSIAIPSDFPILNQNTTGTAANISGTPALPNGTTATTQSAASGDGKIATDLYADNAASVALAAANKTMWSQISSGGSISNTTTPGTIIPMSSAVGTNFFPANSLVAGKVLVWHGFVTISAASSDAISFPISTSGTGIGGAGFTLPTLSGAHTEITVYMLIQNTGTSAGVITQTILSIPGSGSIFTIIASSGTLNTTISQTLNLQAQWSVASPSDALVAAQTPFTLKIE